jgi:solute carrier family 30 (zinc transporter), member 9
MSLRHTAGFRPVLYALVGNALVSVIKTFAALTSGSSAMMSEAVHSIADTANQFLLLIGLRRSLKKADEDFEYGYGNERFFWALVSACGIFFVGAGVTAYHGFNSLLHPEHIEYSFIIIPVLLASFFIELYTLHIAFQQLILAHPSASWATRLRRADSSTLAVVLEDSVAVVGVVVAMIAIGTAYLTGNAMWDAVGSLVIAALLAGVAIVLIIKNHSYLMGQSMPEELREGVIELLDAEPAIEKVIDFKSSSIGLGVYRIKCEVEWNGAALLRELLDEGSMHAEFEEVRHDFETFKRFYVDFAGRVPRLMGKKIDDIEGRIRARYPGIKHIDIEIN